MAITIGDTIKYNSAVPSIDWKYGPYSTVSEAYSTLYDANVICLGLTVGIETPSTGTIAEYWFKDGTAESNLVEKLSAKVTVDTSLNLESSNAISNGVVASAISEIRESLGTAVAANPETTTDSLDISSISIGGTAYTIRKDLEDSIGSLSDLTTTENTSLVGAINEAVESLQGTLIEQSYVTSNKTWMNKTDGVLGEENYGTTDTDGTRITYLIYTFAVSPGDVCYISGRLGSGASGCGLVYLDADYNFISSDLLRGTYDSLYVFTDFQITIPEDCYYIRVQGFTVDPWIPSCKKMVSITNELNKMTTRIDSFEETIITQKTTTVNILIWGNSFTQDSYMYIPWLNSSISAMYDNFNMNLTINLFIAYIGGCPLSQHYANAFGVSVTSGSTTYDSGKSYTFYSSLANGAWTSESKTFSEILSARYYDLIIFQQAGGVAHSDFDTYYAPYLYPLQMYVTANNGGDGAKKPLLGFNCIHGTYATTKLTRLKRYLDVQANTKLVQERSLNQYIFPFGEAVEILRSLDDYEVLGTYSTDSGNSEGHGGLQVDSGHIQDGQGRLVENYANLCMIYKIFGLPYKFMGLDLYPTDDILTTYNIPTRSPILSQVTAHDWYYVQKAAWAAIDNPMAIEGIYDDTGTTLTGSNAGDFISDFYTLTKDITL